MPKDEKKTTQETETPEVSKKEEKQEESTFKQEDVDRIVTERLERADKKRQEEFEEKLEAKIKEVQEMASLTAEEREKELQKKYEEELKQKELTLAERENRLEVIDRFTENNIPIELVDMVIDPDRDKTLEKTDKFIENYQKSVESSVAEKLKGSPPKDVKPNSKKESKKVITAF